jgi:hypothetical protein
MRLSIVFRISCTLMLLGGMSALDAAPKKKKKSTGERAKNQIEFVAQVGTGMNSAVIAPLNVPSSRNIRPSLVSLRDNLLDEAKLKPVASTATYNAAVRLTNAWLSALEEREKRRAALGAAAPPTTDIAHGKKTVLHYWDDILMWERELKDAREKKQTDKQKKAFFKAADMNNWRMRTEVLGPELEQLYSQFREQRRQGP